MVFENGEGFYFRPKEDEVMKYLLDKVCGSKTMGCDYLIHTVDLYGGVEPSEIFREFCGGDIQVYLFTKLKKVAAGNKKTWGQRISRNVGQGVWCNKGQKDPIFGPKGQIIGHKRCFRYERKKKGGGGGGDDDGNGKWLLKEYTLPESARVKEEYRDFALCRLKRKDDGGGRKNHHHGPDVEIGFEEMLEAVLRKNPQQPAPQKSPQQPAPQKSPQQPDSQKSPHQPAPQQPAVPSSGGGDEEDWVHMIDWDDFVCDVVEPGNVPAAGGCDSVFGGELQQGTRVSACGVEGLSGVDGDYFNLNRRLSGGPPVLL